MLPFAASGRPATEAMFLLQALQAASKVLRRAAPSTVTSVKRDWTPVTAADLGVQAALAGMLDQALPGEVLVAEETSDLLGGPRAASLEAAAVEATRLVHPQAGPREVRAWLDRGRGEPEGRFWTLDPVDGTKGLLRGGQYAAALALVEGGDIVLGGLACPRYPETASGGCVAVALRGAGAWMAPTVDGPWTRLAVSGEADPVCARLLRSVESGFTTHRTLARFRKELGTKAAEIRMDSQVKYLALAAGQGDVIVRLPRKRGAQRESIWDHAPGVLLVEEAGGRCTDVLGEELRFAVGRQMVRNLGVLASNGPLHDAALQALRRAAPDSGRLAAG
jgi:3'(2'), 5'-bisphosphate nucleotidase